MNRFEKELELSKPGIWECWRLEDNEVVLIDMLTSNDDHLVSIPTHYKGKKVVEKLGYAMTLWEAYCMYQTHANYDGITRVPMLSNNEIDVDKILQDMEKLCNQTTHQNLN